MAEVPAAVDRSSIPTPIPRRETWNLFGFLVVVALVLSFAIIPGVFIIDEPNYLATIVGLRDGSWVLPETNGLPPSRELVAFDPEDQSRIVHSTPVTSLAPPLYAIFALPFSWFGWTSLFLLNVLSFVVTIWCIYIIIREQGGSTTASVIGIATYVAGGFSLEYALGMWPHMVSVALISLAVLLTLRGLDRPSAGFILAAGLLAGSAVGVREQSIVIVAGLGASVLTFARPRVRKALSFLVGASLPLLLIAVINSNRLGTFHPFPKLGAYSADVQNTFRPSDSPRGGPLDVWWSKVIDFRTHPPFTDPLKERLFRKDPVTGVPLVGGGAVKKALLQSAPWIACAFVVMVFGWRSGRSGESISRRVIGTTTWIVVPVMAMIALAGFGRSDGLAYNQRYFLDLVPLFAILTGSAVGRQNSWKPFFAGATVAMAILIPTLLLIDTPYRYAAIATFPLFLAAGCTATALLLPLPSNKWMLTAMLGVAVGWSFFIHAVDDVRASRDRRSASFEILRSIEPLVPRGSALFTYWGGRDAVGPLMMTKEVLLLDAWADQGQSAVTLLTAIQARGQRTFVRTDGFPASLLSEMIHGRRVVHLRESFPHLIEILPQE